MLFVISVGDQVQKGGILNANGDPINENQSKARIHDGIVSEGIQKNLFDRFFALTFLFLFIFNIFNTEQGE